MEVTWSWKWPEVEGVLLVSRSAADIFRCNLQKSGEYERGGQLFVDPTHAGGIIFLLQQHHTKQTKQAEHGLS